MSFERKLLQAVRSRNQNKIDSVFRDIYYEYGPIVGYVISKYVFVREDVEELINDVFIELSNNLFNISFDNIKGYLVVIAKNKAIDFLRLKENKNIVIYNDEYVNSLGKDTSESDYYDLVEKMKKVLTEDEINIITLHSVYDYTFEELAEKYNQNVSTIKSNYYRAVKKYRREENK